MPFIILKNDVLQDGCSYGLTFLFSIREPLESSSINQPKVRFIKSANMELWGDFVV